MSKRKKKNGRKTISTEKILLATVLIQLIQAVVELITALLE
jgi:hypothetical protein